MEIFVWRKLIGQGSYDSLMEENVTDLRKMLVEDRPVTYFQIEEILGLNVPAIHSILKDNLHLTKLFFL